eukprot:Nitzschia sp. Nitz4//scaffold61_size107673//98277//98909//NITZ4_004254-RA/size107673-processed-gene-0.170-mRNA-1//1//CDS//3329555767//6544//frame0
MTRGLYPPDTLSKEDVATMARVRQEIISQAMVGGGFGAGSGLIFHTGLQWARRLGWTKTTLNRNTLFLSVLGGGAFGMFLFATSAGKERVHQLHHIFQVGAVKPTAELDRQDYNTIVRKATEIPMSMAEQYSDDGEVDMDKLRDVRLARRRSLADRLASGQGFSDAHGGHWYREESDKK